jgi:hypothetical protein
MLGAHKTLSAAFLVMTRSDDHVQNAVPTQKLEWVTPKISLMEAGDTEGSKRKYAREVTPLGGPKYGVS